MRVSHVSRDFIDVSDWSNAPFLISDIQALWRSGLSARAPECQKFKNGGLGQYGPERFEV